MKTGLKVATILGLLIVGMLVFNFALGMISAPSSAQVAVGVIILLAFVVLAVTAGKMMFQKINTIYNRNKKALDVHRSPMVVLAALVVGSSFFNTGCMKAVEPGHVGILVNQYGTYRGVQDFPLKTGAVWYNPFTEDVFEYPTSVQRVIWTKDTAEGKPTNEEINYNSKDELVFTGDFTVSYELVSEKVPAFYVRFRNDKIDQFTHGFFRDQVRDSLNEVAVQYTADELYGEKKGEFLDRALSRVKARVEPFGVNVVSLGYASSPRPPEQVATAINNKISAIQRAIQVENEIRQTEAEAKKKVAEAEGTSKANDLVSRSINPQLVTWQQLVVQQQAINKWNGALPQYSGAGAIPFIQVQK